MTNIVDLVSNLAQREEQLKEALFRAETAEARVKELESILHKVSDESSGVHPAAIIDANGNETKRSEWKTGWNAAMLEVQKILKFGFDTWHSPEDYNSLKQHLDNALAEAAQMRKDVSEFYLLQSGGNKLQPTEPKNQPRE